MGKKILAIVLVLAWHFSWLHAEAHLMIRRRNL